MSQSVHLVVLVLLCGALFAGPVLLRDLWTPDEPRYAEVSREMMLSGDFLVPRTNNEPYYEKPPLLFWFMAAASAPFGEISAATARIPSLLSALLTVFLTYVLASRLYGSRVAFWSALILVINLRFLIQATTGQIDMLLTALMTLSLLTFWLWHTERKTKWLLLFYLGIALGLFAKGPPALLFPVLMSVVFYWGRPKARRELHLISGVIVALVPVAIWLAFARSSALPTGEAAPEAIGRNLFNQTIGRVFLGQSHADAPWYYLKNLPVDLLPWTIFLPWTILYVWKRRKESEKMRLLLCWTVPAFLFLSVCIGKRALYLLPLYPALSILLARSVLDLMSSQRSVWRIRTAWCWSATTFLVAILPIVAHLTVLREVAAPQLYIVSFVALMCSIYTMFVATRDGATGLHRTVAVQMSGILVVCSVVAIPVFNEHKSARELCRPVSDLVAQGVSFDLYAPGGAREEFVFYCKAFQENTLVHPGLEGLDVSLTTTERDRLEGRLLRIMRDGAESVPLDLTRRTAPGDLTPILVAVQQAWNTSDIPEEIWRPYLSAVELEANTFITSMQSESPSYAVVRKRDWLWIADLADDTSGISVVRERQVSSRRMLLVANTTGLEALRKLTSAPTLPIRSDLSVLSEADSPPTNASLLGVRGSIKSLNFAEGE